VTLPLQDNESSETGTCPVEISTNTATTTCVLGSTSLDIWWIVVRHGVLVTGVTKSLIVRGADRQLPVTCPSTYTERPLGRPAGRPAGTRMRYGRRYNKHWCYRYYGSAAMSCNSVSVYCAISAIDLCAMWPDAIATPWADRLCQQLRQMKAVLDDDQSIVSIECPVCVVCDDTCSKESRLYHIFSDETIERV